MDPTAATRDLRIEIEALCARLKRPAPLLLGASKTQSVESIEAAVAGGLSAVGENYAQELVQKHSDWETRFSGRPPPLLWHFIGQLQKNKIAKVVPLVQMIHTIDSIELARGIDRVAALHSRRLDVLVEINVGLEETKAGLPPNQARDLISACRGLNHIRVAGLMTIPPMQESLARNPLPYRLLRELRDDLNQRTVYSEPLVELSMGMSADYAVAIEEGSTIVRVGERIFGKRRA